MTNLVILCQQGKTEYFSHMQSNCFRFLKTVTNVLNEQINKSNS